jgi:acetoacetate decarboxylase
MGFVKTMQELMANARATADFYDAEMLAVFWETKPEIVARLLPPPLEPAEFPIAMAFVAHYPRTNFDVTYHESALFLNAVYQGEEGKYCLAMPVTNDMAMAGGREFYGFPKKMAEIQLTKGKGIVGGWTERHGVRFMEIRAKLSGTFNNAEAEKKLVGRSQPAEDGSIKGVSYLYRPFPTPQAELLDYNPWLIKQETVLRPKEIQFGEAEVILKHSAYDPWAEVEVVKTLGAVYTVGDNSMLRVKAAVGVDPLKFAPYAFLRWDMK